ncbi:Calmodulin and related proteins (EF-Hand superfamily) [Handroanthus impetiginosus]|uniref:Calmodulin and related proteins (EF-Hand superfamily) n=1 Tax=Handroanthus impetiginosus TaxID=429701 RepID=A0A2G9GQB3_9LAMI|nr:Calmodulin and related proteins (EF-Hand superfamily) [Handroanthus impetiginosus]
MAQPSSLSIEVETLNHVLGLVEAFRAFDSDNDGRINAQEFAGIMGSLGYTVSEQDIQAAMQEHNPDGYGLLSLSEFLDMNTEDLDLGCLSGLKTALEGLELEEHELVTGERLYEVVQNMGIELSLDGCLDIVASMDGDGDGAITLEDFKAIVNALI